jgi:hypothetical protein
MSIDRVKIHQKYNGHCAYCGKLILLGEMQVDHIVPQKMLPNLPKYKNDTKNMNPSCRSCNHYKRALPLEYFRDIWLGKLHDRLSKLYTVRIALDYGIIKIKAWDRKFFFEQGEK